MERRTNGRPPFDLQHLNAHGSLTVTRPKIDDFLLDAEERRWRSKEIFGLVAAGKLKVNVGARYSLGACRCRPRSD